MPDITVVVPTHNRAHLLELTLGCIRVQSDVDFEIVVVDDGSSDDTAALLGAMGDPRVREVRHEKARGLFAARNAGIDAAAGEWTAFCDDDDLWAPGKLSAQCGALAALPGASWCCTGAVAVDDRLHVIGSAQIPPQQGDCADAVLSRNVIPAGGSSVMARTELLRSVGGFCEGFPGLEDWELWIRLALRSPIATVDRPVVGYRVHADSMAHDSAKMTAAFVALEQRYVEERSRRGVEVAEASWLKYTGAAQLRSGRRWRAARTHGRLALRHGDLRAGLLAAAGLVLPGLQVRRDRRQGAAMAEAWRAAAEEWLAPLRTS